MTADEHQDENARLRARVADLEAQAANPPLAAPLAHRKVGLPLAIGIFILPIAFAWFLLRKGYALAPRVIGFGWLAIWLVALGASRPDSDQPPNPPSGQAQPVAAAPAAFQIGDPIDKGDYRIIVTNVAQRQSVGAEFLQEKASEGGVLVAVNYTVENISSAPKPAYSAPQIFLIDQNGVRYEADVGKSGAFATERNNDRKIVSDLNPGIRTHDSAVFEVSQSAFDATTWRLQIGNDRSAQVALVAGATPSNAAAPLTNIPGNPAANAAGGTDTAAVQTQQTPEAFSPEEQQLIQREFAENDTCRDQPGDSAVGMAACMRRDKLFQEMKRAGLCWGKQGQSESEKEWHHCGADSE